MGSDWPITEFSLDLGDEHSRAPIGHALGVCAVDARPRCPAAETRLLEFWERGSEGAEGFASLWRLMRWPTRAWHPVETRNCKL